MGWILTFIGLLGGFSTWSVVEAKTIDQRQALLTFKGEIISIQKINFANQPLSYYQFILRTTQGDFTVEAGPEGYLKSYGLVLLPGETIEVDGSLVENEGKQIVLAKRLKLGNIEVTNIQHVFK